MRNQNTTVRVKGADLTVLGVDDTTTKSDDAEQTFQGGHAPAVAAGADPHAHRRA
ncbi:MAG: hypothetical protein IPJ65_03530 [Archangiaceae bacterium]|nr:hypothetical protein [Archangiaceae bacterium]